LNRFGCELRTGDRGQKNFVGNLQETGNQHRKNRKQRREGKSRSEKEYLKKKVRQKAKSSVNAPRIKKQRGLWYRGRPKRAAAGRQYRKEGRLTRRHGTASEKGRGFVQKNRHRQPREGGPPEGPSSAVQQSPPLKESNIEAADRESIASSSLS